MLCRPTDWPDRFILWELMVAGSATSSKAQTYVGLRWHTVTPTSEAEFIAGEKLIRDTESSAPRIDFVGEGSNTFAIRNLKEYIDRRDRQLCCAFEEKRAVLSQLNVALTISRIPTEVPDCLLRL